MVIIAKTWFAGRCAAMEVIIGEMDWKWLTSVSNQKVLLFLNSIMFKVLILKTVSV